MSVFSTIFGGGFKRSTGEPLNSGSTQIGGTDVTSANVVSMISDTTISVISATNATNAARPRKSIDLNTDVLQKVINEDLDGLRGLIASGATDTMLIRTIEAVRGLGIPVTALETLYSDLQGVVLNEVVEEAEQDEAPAPARTRARL